jgi:hypothetical protein
MMCDFNEQQRDAIDYVATHGTIAAGLRIAELQAKVKELQYLREGDERIRIKLQAKVDELKQERNLAWDKGYNVGRNDAHQAIVSLQAKVAQLSAKVLYGLKQEGEK